MAYVDGFVLPVPKRKMAAYTKMAKLSRDVWLEHGALDYREAIADDVPAGKVTSFPQAVKLKAGEAVVFSYAIYKSRADRDRVMKKVMADPRMTEQMEPSKMLFDGNRMFWGGFDTIVESSASRTGTRKATRTAAKRATAKRAATKRKPAARKAATRKAATRRTAAQRTAPKRTTAKKRATKRAPMKRGARKMARR